MSEEVLDPNKYDRRPWGSYTVIDEGADYKVKRIEVLGDKRLSYQRHKFRGEHWYVVAGTGTVTLDGVDHEVKVARPSISLRVRHIGWPTWARRSWSSSRCSAVAT